ncbi:MAG TPA: DeoR/GlpR family DNA-binding transcription regulator [Steroidobacteraceae bacterium]|nr:DeoR/GlpR family DNA-binding transcription regulator [Steroidobacteraceae bacterium]
MIEAERHRLILKLLAERSVLAVNQLCEILGVSEATARRDINALADASRLRRIRGGAEALAPRHEMHLVGVPFELNQGIGAEQKSAIARAAVELIQEGESIIINGGTTTYAMVEFLLGRELDILTNSIPILSRLLARSRNRVTVPGGTVYREQNIVLSPYESDTIAHFWGQKLFTGCYGLNRFGLMEADPLIVRAAMRLLARAEELIVLADSRKFRQRSSMVVAPIERISTLITDARATEAELEPFRKAGIRVITTQVSLAAQAKAL